ncbi:MAG: non-canonical purine NTP diphosphatase [Muribaculaceae bacterium]|jgi:XTP/dITP diphosphohydrolase|nr:non-canonical purine NTP diphosphatase [Muribaculaceae bacterium]
MKDIVFATNNANKLREIREIVGGKFRVLGLKEIGCNEDIEETAETIEGNALIKANFVKEHYDYDCFADDTGMEVAALGGEPGVYSARYAGEDCNSENNIDKVLARLEEAKKHGNDDRSAKFRTAIALIFDGKTEIFEGEVKGKILTERHGTGGFGYDSIFKPDEANCSFAEMKAEEKNAISHRGRATAKLMEYLKK